MSVRIDVEPSAALTDRDRQCLRSVLDAAFCGEFSEDDWQHCLGGVHVVAVDAGVVVAHAAVVPRVLHVAGRRWDSGYVEGVATVPRRQGQGLGSLVMERVGGLVRAEFALGALSTEAVGFYRRHGWEQWQGPTYVRRAAGLACTADEDGGVMVLRVDRSGGPVLSDPIVCEERRGDDW